MTNLLNLVKKLSNLRHLKVKSSIFVENEEVTNILFASRHFGLAWCLLEDFNVRAFNSQDRELKINITGRPITIKIARYNYAYQFSLSYDSTGSLVVKISNNQSNKTPDIIAKEIVEWAIQLVNMLLEKSGQRSVYFNLSDAVCADKEIMACWQQLREYHVSYLSPNTVKDGSYNYLSTIVINGQRYNIDGDKKSIQENNANSPCIYSINTFEDFPVIYTDQESTSSLDTMLRAIKEDLSYVLDKAHVINMVQR